MAPRRFELTEDERALVAKMRENPLTLTQRAMMLMRSPMLVPEILNGLLLGAKAGLRNNDSLVWLLDGERFRQAIPGVARSVTWTNERPFVRCVSPRLSPGMRALEIGCGDGRVARHIAPLVGELVCADLSPTMLTEARENLAPFPNVDFCRVRGVSLSAFQDGEFDFVYARGVIAHLDLNQALALLDEAARVLRDGGLFAADLYTANRPANSKERLVAARDARRRNRFTAGMFRPYVKEQIEAMCKAVGLGEITGEYAEGEDGRRGNYMIVAVKTDDPVGSRGPED